jgi:hypothetical protein
MGKNHRRFSAPAARPRLTARNWLISRQILRAIVKTLALFGGTTSPHDLLPLAKQLTGLVNLPGVSYSGERQTTNRLNEKHNRPRIFR